MEKYIHGKVIYDGKIVRLNLDEVECDNGKKTHREIVHHPGGAAILCISKTNKILFVKQYRYACQEYVYEIPAGKIEREEDPIQTATREFEEETGYQAITIEYMTTILPTIGYSNERIFLYVVKDYKKTKRNLDEDESIETVWINVEKVFKMIESGTIKDAKTLCAIFYYTLKMKKENFTL